MGRKRTTTGMDNVTRAYLHLLSAYFLIRPMDWPRIDPDTFDPDALGFTISLGEHLDSVREALPGSFRLAPAVPPGPVVPERYADHWEDALVHWQRAAFLVPHIIVNPIGAIPAGIAHRALQRFGREIPHPDSAINRPIPFSLDFNRKEGNT